MGSRNYFFPCTRRHATDLPIAHPSTPTIISRITPSAGPRLSRLTQLRVSAKLRSLSQRLTQLRLLSCRKLRGLRSALRSGFLGAACRAARRTAGRTARATRTAGHGASPERSCRQESRMSPAGGRSVNVASSGFATT